MAIAKKELQYYKKKLLAKKEELLSELKRLDKASLHETAQEGSGDLSGYVTHMADVATDSYEQEKNLNFMDNIESTLSDVERALDKIAGKNFGKCEKCGKDIIVKRLKAEPYASLCMECKTAEEERRSVSRVPVKTRKKRKGK